MRRTLRLVLVVGIAVAGCVFLDQRQAAQSGDLSLAQSDLDLGTLPMEQEHEVTVIVRNRSDRALRIVGVEDALC